MQSPTEPRSGIAGSARSVWQQVHNRVNRLGPMGALAAGILFTGSVFVGNWLATNKEVQTAAAQQRPEDVEAWSRDMRRATGRNYPQSARYTVADPNDTRSSGGKSM